MADGMVVDLTKHPSTKAIVSMNGQSKEMPLKCGVCDSTPRRLRTVWDFDGVYGFICLDCADNAANSGLTPKEALDAKQ
jgi:hypothetical protein